MFKFFKWLFAVGLILFGVTLILQNLQIITLEISDIIWDSWPIIFVVLGFWWFVNYFRTVPGGSWFWGIFFFVFGSLLWAGNFELIDYSFLDVWRLWPLILVYIGANLLTGKKTMTVQVYSDRDHGGNNHRTKVVDKFEDHFNDSFDEEEFDEAEFEFRKEDEKSTGKRFGKYDHYFNNSKSFVTELNMSKNNWSVEPLDVRSGIIDAYIDFSKAYIPEKETKVMLRGYIGDVVIKVPEHVAVKIDGRVSIGEVSIFNEERSGIHNRLSYESADYKQASRRLDIHASYQIGEVKVLSV
ncbi:cell wall-active antibiotics response protein LiaF [Alkalibacillus silvisoli]|uniref:Lia operon protein LiaF n=1 Tax=Alkalibacillus silvisoli TaxID=392823 RepID=A0ABN1AA06_9BACI